MKKELRQKILSLRQALPVEVVREKSLAIADRIFERGEFTAAQTVMLYLPFRKEVDTVAVIERCFAEDKKVVIPISEVATRKLILSELKEYPGDLTTGAYGILEPRPDCIRPVADVDIDLVLVPGVGFDIHGNRLGYGAGFYDRFFERLRPGVPLIAPAFELQVVENTHPEAHDRPVNLVITEERVINCH